MIATLPACAARAGRGRAETSPAAAMPLIRARLVSAWLAEVGAASPAAASCSRRAAPIARHTELLPRNALLPLPATPLAARPCYCVTVRPIAAHVRSCRQALGPRD